MNEILKNLSYFIISSGLITWLIKAIFDQYFSKDLEKFKSHLENEAYRQRIRYEKMHSERAEVIKEVYRKMVVMHRSFGSLMSWWQEAGDKDETEKTKIAVDDANDFTNYYEQNRLFFDEKLAKNLDLLSDNFRSAWIKFTTSRKLNKFSDEYIKYWQDAWNIIDKEVPKIKIRIEKKFRKIIGINEN